MGGRVLSSESYAKLFMSSADLTSWSVLATPAYCFAITTYLSQLVLVGGIEVETEEMTNKLWTSNLGNVWSLTLPPMPTPRCSASAVNIMSPECLVVAGGEKDEYLSTCIVEMFLGGQWSTLQTLPRRCYDIKFTIHSGTLFMMGGFGQDNTIVYWSRINSILSFSKDCRGKNQQSLWKRFSIPLMCSSLASFGKQLIFVGIKIGVDCTKILAHLSLSNTWAHVGDMPIELRNTFSIVLPTQELVVIGVDESTLIRQNKRRVFKVSLTGNNYYRVA